MQPRIVAQHPPGALLKLLLILTLGSTLNSTMDSKENTALSRSRISYFVMDVCR